MHKNQRWSLAAISNWGISPTKPAFTAGDVRITSGKGKRGGSVIGGQVFSGGSIDIHWAGAPSQVTTTLLAGGDPESMR
ncbi:MAG: hypothetical protein ACKVJG_18015 [Candidatus Latescibacterota bacterium]